jgi:hypothetical protein
MYTKFWSENLKGRDYMEDLGVYGKIILEWILGKQGGELWIIFIDRDQWRATVNTVMNLCVP